MGIRIYEPQGRIIDQIRAEQALANMEQLVQLATSQQKLQEDLEALIKENTKVLKQATTAIKQNS